jgi:hypothetical protein
VRDEKKRKAHGRREDTEMQEVRKRPAGKGIGKCREGREGYETKRRIEQEERKKRQQASGHA